MRQLLYVSTAAGLTANDMNHILLSSRANNALLDVTGLLLYIEGGFLQILEGDERTVRELYNQIARDRRHDHPRLMLDRQSPRAFDGWSMGFEWLDGEDPESAGMFAVAREAIEGRLSPGAGSVVATMLQTFYRVQKIEALGQLRAG